jgi:hypothetical protein
MVLNASQYSADQATFTTNLYADFSTDRGQWDGCTRNQLGSCWYYDCPAGSNGLGVISNPVLEDAGTLFVTGSSGRVDLGLGQGIYFARNMTELWPLSGGPISFSVVGNSSVPAFTIQIAAPPFVLLTSMNGEAAPSVITRSAGAKLVWTSSGNGASSSASLPIAARGPARSVNSTPLPTPARCPRRCSRKSIRAPCTTTNFAAIRAAR